MSDYRVDIKVRNNVILKKLKENGYETLGEFCRLNGVMKYVSTLGKVIAMQRSPFTSKGEFIPAILFLAEKLNCNELDLFTDQQLNTILESNKRTLEVKEAELKFLLENTNEMMLLEDQYSEDEKKKEIENALNTISPREKLVIEMRMGLGGYKEHTLREIGEIIGTQQERVRQIEAKALRKLRHPSRHGNLKEFVGLEE